MKIKDPISTTEASHILGVSSSTVRKWVENDKIEHVRIGKNNFVSRRKIRSMAKKRKTEKATGAISEDSQNETSAIDL